MKEIFDQLNKPRAYLLLANILLVFFLILLSNLGVLPFGNTGDFVFFTLVYLAFALYRPDWSFLFFIGTIALENINLAPEGIGIMIRPYQFIGALTILAVLIKLPFKRLEFKLPKWNWYDALFIFFAIAGFLSALGSEASKLALKQSVIALSFVALYFLVRIFIQSFEDLKKIIPFFLSSSVIIMLYGGWQNIRFLYGLNSFETMPGRPNATFAEADWFGIFLVLTLAILFSIIYYCHSERSGAESKNLINNVKLKMILLYVYLTLIFILLILTVSRSAWLGAIAVIFFFIFIIFTDLKFDPRKWQWKNTINIKLKIILSLLISIAIVYIFHLTSFQLENRAQSTGSGLQKITVSCQSTIILPEKIKNISELPRYGCRHINLEEIATEKTNGNFVTEIYRADPNISIRGEIYQKSWEQIKAHPIFGIGWGSIGKILGSDANGNALNSSNIFLEVWLGAGILGLVSFAITLIYILINGIKNFQNKSEKYIFGLFLILGLIALVIPNLFNAGIFLGFVWIFLALANIRETA